LVSALGNLVQNAIKFTKSPGNITIVVKATDADAIIEVRDQCGGIPEGKIKEIFKPFAQEGKDRSGLGLGLLISRRAVEKCHGTLTAHNSEDGCIFTVAIPLLAPAINGLLRPVV